MRFQREHRQGRVDDDRRLHQGAHIGFAGRARLHASVVVPVLVGLLAQRGVVLVVRERWVVLVIAGGFVLRRVLVRLPMRVFMRANRLVLRCPLVCEHGMTGMRTVLQGAVRMRNAVRHSERGRREAGDQRQQKDGPAGPSGSGHGGNVAQGAQHVGGGGAPEGTSRYASDG